MLVIGIGNPDRGDDAAGILVARYLRERGILAVEHVGATLSLIDSWEASGRVIAADAVVSGAELGAIRVWNPGETNLEHSVFRSSTHEFSLADTVELARALNRLPAWMRVYGIEGAHFEPASEPSEKVIAAAARVAQEIERTVSSRASI